MKGDRVDVAIIGGGVVGAAVAQRLSAGKKSCWLLERQDRIGGQTSERNSGVVHAGLYYPPGSLKTRLCIEGNRLLREWAGSAGVPYVGRGKLVVAVDEPEVGAVERLYEHGRTVGVEGLSLLSARELGRLEPGVTGRAALLSRTTGVVDPVDLTRSLVAAARSDGAEVIVSCAVSAVRAADDGYELETSRGPVQAAAVVNAAGLYADEVAAMAGVGRYAIHPCRGDWFRLRTTTSFSHLVYPVKGPGTAGLGVHLTIDMDGGVRLGPDAQYVRSKEDYCDAPHKRSVFAKAAGRMLRGLSEADLTYDSCGIRPKLRGPGEAEERDFVIAEDLPRFVNLVGIESPGLTSALAIAAEVDRNLD